MFLEINGTQYELKFGFRFLRALDESKVVEDKTNGLSTLDDVVLRLGSGSVDLVPAVAKAALAHHAQIPTDEDIEAALEVLAEKSKKGETLLLGFYRRLKEGTAPYSPSGKDGRPGRKNVGHAGSDDGKEHGRDAGSNGGKDRERLDRERLLAKGWSVDYDQILIDGYRFLGMTPDEVLDMTYHEFTVLVYANQLKTVDGEYRDHKMAFLHQMAKQTEGAGKNVRPKYATLQSFYDYKEEIDKINNPEKYKAKQRMQDDIASFAMKFNQGGET